MSRVGKQPIVIPAGVQVTLDDLLLIVKGPKGELRREINRLVKLAIADNVITVTVKNEVNKKERALWGLYRNLIANMIIGVTAGFEKKLEINGVGFKAEAGTNKLTLNVGFSHQVIFPLPEGIKVEVAKNIISVSGIDKELVGQVSANIRKIKKPEPYNGKGIKYVDEVIRRKAGKSVTKSE